MSEIIPMLAQPHKTIHPKVDGALETLLQSDNWYYEEKYDGVRAIIYVASGSVKIINRRIADTTFRYPEIVAAMGAAYPTGQRIFDGEIICLTDGKPDFPKIHRRDAQHSQTQAARLLADMPATFAAFDLLGFDGDDLRVLPFRARQKLLNVEAAGPFEPYDPLLMLAIGGMDGQTMWDYVTKDGREGLIAKQLTSRYVPGRSPSWVKLKPTQRISALVTGYDPGKGSRKDTFGALHLALLNERSELTPIGAVGTGFNGQDLKLVLEHLNSGAALVVEVEYQGLTSGKQLRFPSFKGIRQDVELLDCTLDQLDTEMPLDPH